MENEMKTNIETWDEFFDMLKDIAQAHEKHKAEIAPEHKSGEAADDFSDRPLKPMTVKNLPLWCSAKKAFELRLGALPPKLARLRWFEAVCALEAEEDATPGQRLMKTNVLQVIAVSLGLPEVNGFYPIVATEDGVQILLHQENGQWRPGGEKISSAQLDELRKRICAINGYKMPDEAEDPSLAKAAETGKAGDKNAPVLELNREDLCAAMAVVTGCEPEEILNWPMKKFNAMAAAVTRMEQYRTCGLLEATGFFKFKNGNPVPSWMLERKVELPTGIAFVSELNASASGLI